MVSVWEMEAVEFIKNICAAECLLALCALVSEPSSCQKTKALSNIAPSDWLAV